MKEKLLSVMLAVSLVLGLMPATALAVSYDDVIELTLGEEYTAEEDLGDTCFSFTPDEAGIYTFYAQSDDDVDGELYDADDNLLFSDYYTDCEVSFTTSIEAGETLYFNVINMTAGTIAGVSEADTGEDASGSCGDDLTWEYDADSLSLTISGTGAMDDASGTKGSIWYDYRDYVVSITIEEGVTTIGDYAFCQFSSLKSVSFPESLTAIGEVAFYECGALKEVTFCNNLLTIGRQAFEYCSSLTTLVIPESVTYIGKMAFYNCDGLTSVSVPESTEMAASAFGDCEGLFDDDGLLIVNDVVFDYNGARTAVTIPEGITTLGSCAFSWQGIRSISLPDSLTLIMDDAFWSGGCDFMVIPAGVTQIEDGAFAYGALETIVFEGDAPFFGNEDEYTEGQIDNEQIFCELTVTAYYPADNDTWTEDVMQDYGGTVTWIAYEEGTAPWFAGEEMTGTGDYEVTIEAGETVYFSFTPDTTGYYTFTADADDDTVIVLYDASGTELAYESGYPAEIKEELTAGETCYIGVRYYSSSESGSVVVSLSQTLKAVSASLSTAQELTFEEGLDAYIYYDDDDEAYSYYSISNASFSEGDEIIITMNDDSTTVFTYNGDWFYDENDSSLSWYQSDDQGTNHWETGTYTTYLVLEDYDDVTVEVTVTIVENSIASSAEDISQSGEGTAVIDEKGGYAYFSYTPSETGSYQFYTAGSEDTYAILYDSNFSVIDSDDDSGSGTNALIRASLTEGETYYIAFRFYYTDDTGSFSIYAERYYAAVSAQLTLTSDIEMIEGIDSYEEEDYDEDTDSYVFYNYYSLSNDDFSSGDQIVVTYEDGSTKIYTHNGTAFYDTDGNRLYFYTSSTQSASAEWEAGGTYEFTMTLYNNDYVTVTVSVSIIENPYNGSTAVFTPAGEAGSYYFETMGYYSSYYGYYRYYWDSLKLFSQGDQITITLSDGTTEVYTATLSSDGYDYSFEDADGNSLTYSTSSYFLNSEEWTAGTYSVTMTVYSAAEVEIPVVIESACPVSMQYELAGGASAVSVTPEENGCWYTDDEEDEEEWYYYYLGYLFNDGDRIILTLSDGSTESFTYDADNQAFYNSDGEYETIYWYTTQYTTHWETGGTYYIYLGFDNYSLEEILIPVTVGGEALSSSNVTLSASSFTYSGSEQTPTVTVKNAAGTTLTGGTDYTITYSASTRKAVGTYTITVTGKGNYTGSVSKEYKITARALSSASISLSASSYTYSGSAQKPTVTAKYSSTTLTSGTDYTVSYSNNINIGTATVTITGKGNYTGSVSKTFTITPGTVTLSSVKSSAAKKLTVKWTKLSGSVQYQIAYQKNGSSSWTYKEVSASTVSSTLTGLTALKKYNVKVRAYKKVGSDTYYGAWSSTKSATVKKAQTLTVKTSTKTVSYSKVKKAKQTVKAITKVSGAKGTVTYTKSSGKSYFTVNKSTGKITVKKGTPKGTYTIKIKVTSAARGNYVKASKTVTVKIKVK